MPLTFLSHVYSRGLEYGGGGVKMLNTNPGF